MFLSLNFWQILSKFLSGGNQHSFAFIALRASRRKLFCDDKPVAFHLRVKIEPFKFRKGACDTFAHHARHYHLLTLCRRVIFWKIFILEQPFEKLPPIRRRHHRTIIGARGRLVDHNHNEVFWLARRIGADETRDIFSHCNLPIFAIFLRRSCFS